MLHWKSDDLFVLPELEDLEKCFRDHYCFETDIFSIPSENSHLELMLRIGDMVKQYESEQTLFVVYYGGHARIDESRQSTWCAYVTTLPSDPQPSRLTLVVIAVMIHRGYNGLPSKLSSKDQYQMC